MKRSVSILAALILALLFCVSVCGEGVSVYVTVSGDDAPLAVKYEKIAVSDIDGDGTVTINDALFAAHEEFYESGAAEGYESVSGEYGLSLNKLWGRANGGSYGYYLNNASASNLLEPVSDGDHLYAYSYTDLVSWSDTYCFFDLLVTSCEEGAGVTLTLSAAAFDESWNPITVPINGASITLDGEDTGVVTDENGKATVSCDKAGEYIISAVSETRTLVPPICKLTVVDTTPENGIEAVVIIAVLAVLSALLAVAFSALRKKKTNEK